MSTGLANMRSSRVEQTQGILADLRLVAVGAVAIVAPSNPDFALRAGAVICGVVLVTRLIGGFRLGRVDVCAALLALLAWLSTAWTIAPAATAVGWQNYAACAVIIVTVRSIAQRRRDVRGLALAVVIGCGVGLMRLLLDNPTASLSLTYDSTATGRVGIAGLNYNALSYAFVGGAAMLMVLWCTAANPRLRRVAALPALGGALALLAGVMLSGTRGAILAFVALAAWLLLGRMRWAFRLMAVIAILVHATIFSGVADKGLAELFPRTARETGDLNGRLGIWPLARDAFWDNPILGLGVDGVTGLPSNPANLAAHNLFLDLGSGLGFAGLLLGAAIAVSVFRDALSGEASSLRRLAAGAVLAVLVPITATGFWVESPVMWLILGIVSSLPVTALTQDSHGETSP